MNLIQLLFYGVGFTAIVFVAYWLCLLLVYRQKVKMTKPWSSSTCKE